MMESLRNTFNCASSDGARWTARVHLPACSESLSPPERLPVTSPPPASSCVFTLSDGEEHPGEAARGAAVGRQLSPGDATQTLLPPPATQLLLLSSWDGQQAAPCSSCKHAVPQNYPESPVIAVPFQPASPPSDPLLRSLLSTCPSK